MKIIYIVLFKEGVREYVRTLRNGSLEEQSPQRKGRGSSSEGNPVPGSRLLPLLLRARLRRQGGCEVPLRGLLSSDTMLWPRRVQAPPPLQQLQPLQMMHAYTSIKLVGVHLLLDQQFIHLPSLSAKKVGFVRSLTKSCKILKKFSSRLFTSSRCSWSPSVLVY